MRSCFALVLSLALLPLTAVRAAAAQAPAASEPVAAVLANDGGLDAQTVRAFRVNFRRILRAQGLSVSEDPRFDLPLDSSELADALHDAHLTRAYVLHLGGQLGTRLPLEIAEVDAEGHALFDTSLHAQSLDDAETVMQRLIEAALSHKPAEDNARYGTVVRDENRPILKKSGDMSFDMGLPLALDDGHAFGVSLGLRYELTHFAFGLGLDVLGGRAYALTADARWLPLDGEFTPFVGLGL
ncbi:MAG: hypothetical protein JST92_12180, partial [Deltaproteobacteria bacterium]|nr:hypothetical protein [Deltaproteobacteria bacterium]